MATLKSQDIVLHGPSFSGWRTDGGRAYLLRSAKEKANATGKVVQIYAAKPDGHYSPLGPPQHPGSGHYLDKYRAKRNQAKENPILMPLVIPAIILAGVAGLAYWAFKPAAKTPDAGTGSSGSSSNPPAVDPNAASLVGFYNLTTKLPAPTANETLDAYVARMPAGTDHKTLASMPANADLLAWVNANPTKLLVSAALPQIVAKVVGGKIVDQAVTWTPHN